MARRSKAKAKNENAQVGETPVGGALAVTNQADRMTYTYTPSEEGGRSIVFYIPNENSSKINTEGVPFEQKCEALMQSALKVRRQNLFSNVDLVELAKACYSFKPFTYQIENVNTMLNRFEGHGVFGDQVGLGKTVQALMTAHVMFLSGVIRNAVIVVPEKTVDGWKKEIEEKFPNIFKVVSPSDNSTLETVLRRIDNENKNIERLGDKRVYILTDTMLDNRQFERMAEELRQSNTNEKVKAPLSPEDEALLDRIRAELVNMCSDDVLSGFSFDPQTLLEGYGWGSRGGSGTQIYSMDIWNLNLCKKTVAMLEEALNSVKAFYSMREDITGSGARQIGTLESLLAYAREQNENAIRYSEYRSAFTPLFQSGEDRLIDLMIVDEVHSFYSQASMENLLGHRMTAVNILADIEKKYCVLLSATPIRTRLEDIFDLIYLVARERMGYTRKEAENFFYQTMCQVDPNEPDKLAYMINNNPDRFFGLVNNFFTRKRIEDVKDDMKGFADRAYAALGKEEKAFLDSRRKPILDHTKILYMQDGRDGRNMQEHLLKDFEAWKENNLTDAPHLAATHLNFDMARARLRSAIDSELISLANDPRETRERSHMAHSLADWRRRGKKGLFIRLDMNNSPAPDSNGLIESKLKTIVDECWKKRASAEAVRDTLAPLYIGEYGDYWNLNDESLSQNIYKALTPFMLSLLRDAVVYYAPGTRIRKFVPTLRQSYMGNRNVNLGCQQEVTLEHYNTIAVVDQWYQAGVNLQKHSAFVFAGMNKTADSIMDPVDIEQWIGRVHRTGQVKDCHIVTMVDEQDPNRNFLRQYYILLSDPQGLDLYGDTTPDVAFLQPVIVDIIKHTFDIPKMQEAVNKAFPTANVSADSFANLIRVCYLYDVYELQRNRQNQNEHSDYMEQIRDLIRELCRIPEFGKPAQAWES